MVAKRKSEGYSGGIEPVRKFDADKSGDFQVDDEGDVVPMLVDVTDEPPIPPKTPPRPFKRTTSPLAEDSVKPVVLDGEASISIVDRWEDIDTSLESLGNASKHTGIVTISESDSPVRRSQQARYGSDYWSMVQRSKELISDEEAEAKEAFARAFGGKVMVAAGLWTEEIEKAELDKAYKKFKEKYGGSDSAKTKPKNPRAKYRKRIEKSVTKYNGD